jgi:hypothetical protein
MVRSLSCFALLVVSATASALQPANDLASRVQTADLIVLAEPVSSECVFVTGTDWLLETRVTLAPRETWKGEPPTELELVLPGGELGELGVIVEDVPTLTVGQPTVLLLADTPVGWVVVGGEAGAIDVRACGRGDGRPVDQVRRVIERFLP